MTHRTARVGELIRQELSTILAREHNFGNMFVTVHHAEVAADLKNCTVYVGIIGGNESGHQSVIDRLNKAAGAIQRPLYKRVTLKSSPRLFFKLDRSAERGVRIVNAMEDLPEPAPETDEPMGKFEGKDGLDHRWEDKSGHVKPQSSRSSTSGNAFFNTASDDDSEEVEEDEEEIEEEEDEEDEA